LNQAPNIEEYYPLYDPALLKNEIQEFNITATDPNGDNLTYRWYLNKTWLNHEKSSYLFESWKHGVGMYLLEVYVSDRCCTDTHQWIINVSENIPPIITGYYPLTDPFINTTDFQEFNISVIDPNARELSYTWLLDGVIVYTGTESYIFNPATYTNGIYNLTVIVSDGLYSVSHQWMLYLYSEVPVSENEYLKIIMDSTPRSFDGLDQWDVSSQSVINQICETLFQYDYTNLSYPLRNHLANHSAWMNSTTLRIWIRNNVFFHNNTTLNAAAVKWNLDRIQYFTNATGKLPSNTSDAYPGSLYYFSDGVTPIINEIVIIDEYILDINLNAPYSPLKDLLSYTSSAIYSPASTPRYRYLDKINEYPVGTGPFILTQYILQEKAIFVRFENYWRELPSFERVDFTYISDPVAASQVMLNLQHDYLFEGGSPDFFSQFQANPDITFLDFTNYTGQTSPCYWYVGINNMKIPLEIRAALNYAYNYTFLIEEYYQGNSVKANSPLSPMGFSCY
jgi:ABC-type transport system substrate-binding protein